MFYDELEELHDRPKPFQYYTARELWADDHTSSQMLKFHLDGSVDLSSRRIEFIQRSVRWIVDRFGVGGSTRIADFGCGPGLYTTRLASAGAQVTGIDFSERSIGYAREEAKGNGLDIDYVNEDYLEFQTQKKFDLIIMIMGDFCVLSPYQRKKLLKKFHTIIDDGGSILLDVYSLKGFDERKELSTYEVNSLNQFWSPNKYYGFLNVFKYDDEKVVLDKYTIFERNRKRTIYNWLQYFSKEDISREFEDHGFKIGEYLSNVAGDPFDPDSTEFAVIAGKS
ncbi:MAG: class I SAM-dependent methyltransferase [Thermoplasmatota archaeon]